ncbi:Der GTPase-activating protein YihI [Bowmanella denitrificans]|uniref:Der GTPase-activating protein YihI n=1 Tax=Bowmanella denitrificans TaxID=366582 RepID=UPI000C9CF628|nr:Der GTPase-activating protein YihI [Bowmanella denitrificans]
MPKPLRPKKSPKSNVVEDKKPKRRTGKPAGNRNNTVPKREEKVAKAHRDPRIGSKKPVVLIADKAKTTDKARFFSPAAELKAIEADQRLDGLMDKIDAGQALTAEEQRYVDGKLSRHQELCALMGIAAEDDQDIDEQDLLDKFENSSLDPFRK